MQLSVIIVNYNVKYFLEQCLHSVTKALQAIDGEIIVVDNRSTDGSKAYLEGRFPGVSFTWNRKNIGFSRANNQGMQLAKGEYVLFLNPDTLLPEDCLEKCLAFFSKRQDAGAIGVRMVDGSGQFLKESKRAFPDPLTSLFKISGLAHIFPRSGVFAKYHLGHLDEYSDHQVDVLAGAFLMARRTILIDLHGFDKNFFMYGEDIDLSYRIQKTGYKNYYFAGTTIIHFKGESTKRGSLNYVKMFYNAMSIFVSKHYGGARAGVYRLLIKVAIFLRAGLAAFTRFFGFIAARSNDLILFRGAERSTAKARSVMPFQKKRPDRHIFYIASKPEEYAPIKALLSNTGEKNVEMIPLDPNNELKNAPAIKELLVKRERRCDIKLILSDGSMTHKEMIYFLQQVPTDVETGFFSVKSQTIVGSSDRFSSGSFIHAGS